MRRALRPPSTPRAGGCSLSLIPSCGTRRRPRTPFRKRWSWPGGPGTRCALHRSGAPGCARFASAARFGHAGACSPDSGSPTASLCTRNHRTNPIWISTDPTAASAASSAPSSRSTTNTATRSTNAPRWSDASRGPPAATSPERWPAFERSSTMGKPDEFDPRLKAYLHRGASTPPPAGMDARIIGAAPRRKTGWGLQVVAAGAPPPPAGMDARIIGAAPRRKTGWVLQVVAAAAVLVLAIGLGIVIQRARQSVGVTPTATPFASPITKPTPYPTPTTSGAAYPLLPPASMHMINKDTGWAAGSGTNRILRTMDGGSHWNDVT